MDVREHDIRIRSEAIGMLRSGVTQQNVALDMDVSLKSVKRWRSTYKKGETKTRSGGPPILNRIMKIVISKSMGKGRQSTRKIARRLNTDSNPVSYMTIYRYLKNCIGASAFKRQKIPRLSAKTSKTDSILPRNIKVGR